MVRTALIVALLFTSIFALAANKYHYTWTPQLKEAYQLATALRLAEAEKLLKTVEKEEPNNLLRHHVANYIDFFVIFLAEQETDFRRLEPNKDRRLAAVENGPTDSPNHQYVQANIYLQWAIARLKFGEYAGAFRDVNKAFKLLEANDAAFPGFLPNKKELGLLHAVVGTIPDQYKWGVELFSSLHGTIEQGQREIELVLAEAKQCSDFIYAEETMVFYAYLLLHLADDSKEAWELLQNTQLQPSKSLLATFVKANVAMRINKNDEAIRLLEARPKGSQYATFDYLDFMLGVAKLRRLDADAAVPLRRYVNHFKGKNFIKEAWQKLAWSALLIEQNEQGYRRAMAACLTEGNATVGGDKSALEEAENGALPNKLLLKARLLYDGGYYTRAAAELKEFPLLASVTASENLEHYYRLGRIYQAMENTKEARRYYQRTIDLGADSKLYFACNAALQLGLMAEDAGKFAEAKTHFERCLSLKPNAYRNGLHQQAKAGLNRIN